MKIVFKLVFVMMLVSSCANSSRSTSGDVNALDHGQCVNYGFAENSFEYKNCIQKLKDQRASKDK